MNVLAGGMDQVKAPSYPATHRTFCIIARLRAEPIEIGQEYVLTSKVFRPGGQPWVPDVSLSFKVKRNAIHEDRGNYVTCCLIYYEFLIPEPGEYVFRLYVGDNELGNVSFDALLVEKGQKT